MADNQNPAGAGEVNSNKLDQLEIENAGLKATMASLLVQVGALANKNSVTDLEAAGSRHAKGVKDAQASISSEGGKRALAMASRQATANGTVLASSRAVIRIVSELRAGGLENPDAWDAKLKEVATMAATIEEGALLNHRLLGAVASFWRVLDRFSSDKHPKAAQIASQYQTLMLCIIDGLSNPDAEQRDKKWINADFSVLHTNIEKEALTYVTTLAATKQVANEHASTGFPQPQQQQWHPAPFVPHYQPQQQQQQQGIFPDSVQAPSSAYAACAPSLLSG
jgi:hypothetical protein